MLLLRALVAVFVLAKTPAAARVVDIKFDPSLEMPPLPDTDDPDTFETYTVHTCLESLENDPELPSKLCKLKDGDELLEIGLGLGVVVGSGTVGTMVHVTGGDSPAGGGRGAVEMHTLLAATGVSGCNRRFIVLG